MLVIDGSLGEGGGQVLRTSLSLSALTGRPFRIRNIRANRSTPGLRPQHLAAVRAAAEICKAELEGDHIEAKTLVFVPGEPTKGGQYSFDVVKASPSGRSAGSTSLIFQTLLWPLIFAQKPSELILRGGTFVPYSPPFQYLAEVFGTAAQRFGISMVLKLNAWGWMAAGGGEIEASIEPVRKIEGVHFDDVSDPEIQGVAAVSNLPSHIPHRMARRAHNLLADAGFIPEITPQRERGPGPGAGIILWRKQVGVSSLGRKGLPANEVAEAAVADLLSFEDNGAAIDHHLADQLLVPMALAHGNSSFTTSLLTRHTLTNVNLLRQWLNVKIKIKGELGQPGSISLTGIGFEPK
jgi:RNA 3'-terminal phosphate cyclase (ATP)